MELRNQSWLSDAPAISGRHHATQKITGKCSFSRDTRRAPWVSSESATLGEHLREGLVGRPAPPSFGIRAANRASSQANPPVGIVRRVPRTPDLRPVGWVGVELRHFLALDAVATEGSFNRAAERLGYTQSAVSQQIAALERTVGERLVERPGGSQPVRLTRAGEIVIQHARAIGERLATAQADLQSLAAGGLDPLGVAFPGHGLGALMPAVLRDLDGPYPDLVLRIVETADDEEVVGMLRRGEVDLGFAYLPLAADDCEHTMLFEDDYVLVVGSEWAEAKPADRKSTR